MRKINLNKAAEAFEMVSADTHLFYNTETGEFDFYTDDSGFGDGDAERFEEDCWITCPGQYDFNEYDMMVDFTKIVVNPQKNELLCVALEGKGAFRRFKDTLYRVGLVNDWCDFKHKAYFEYAREWCEDNGIEYDATEAKQTTLEEDSAMQTVHDFLKKAGTYYLATMDGDQPRVRPFGTINLFEGKLYIQTGKKKDVAKQICDNPKAELSAFDGETWIRVAATLAEDHRAEAQESMLAAYPSLRGMYAVNDGNCVVYYLKDVTATFYAFGGEPREVKF